MTKHVLFIQGAGEGAYKEDKKLVESLTIALGQEFEVLYPKMPNEEDASYDQWKDKIENELKNLKGKIILVGHSVGASILIKYLSETKQKKSIAGILLLASPFWGGDGWRYEGYKTLELSNGFAARLPKNAQIYLYHCRDDEIVPFDHLALYAQVLPQAIVRKFEEGGHQFNNDLSIVARDMLSKWIPS